MSLVESNHQAAEPATSRQIPTRVSAAEFDNYLLSLIDRIAEDPETHVNYLRHESFYAQRSIYAALCRHLGNDGQQILELGSGHGLLSVALAHAGYTVCAVDYFIHKAARLAEQTGNAACVRSVEQNLENDDYGLEPNCYDAVISVDVIEHLKNVRSFFRNAHAALKPGGLLLVHTPNYARLTTRFRALKSVVRPVWPTQFRNYITDEPYIGHLREYTPGELRQALEIYGFEIVEQQFPKSVSTSRIPHRLRNCGPVAALGIRLSMMLQNGIGALCPSLKHCQLVIGRKP